MSETQHESPHSSRNMLSPEAARAALEAYEKLAKFDEEEEAREAKDTIVGSSVDSHGQLWVTRQESGTGNQYREPLAGAGFNRDTELHSEEQTSEVDKSIAQKIAQELVYAHVHTLSPENAQMYMDAIRKHEYGEIDDEALEQIENLTINYLNMAFDEGFVAVDERMVLQQARDLSTIKDEARRNERLADITEQLLDED